MTIVDVFTDFDGTITKREGRFTVTSPFYKSLIKDAGFTYSYKTSPMKNADEVQSLFEKKFGPYDKNFNYDQEDADLLMSADAVAFFHQLLKEDTVRISIITKNRQDYIKALFHYQGFSQEEINKLTICCRGFKFEEVTEVLDHHEDNRADQVYVLDDNQEDFRDMQHAVMGRGYKEETIHGHYNPVGKFNWDQYANEIQSFLSDAKDQETCNKTSKYYPPLQIIGLSAASKMGYSEKTEPEEITESHSTAMKLLQPSAKVDREMELEEVKNYDGLFTPPENQKTSSKSSSTAIIHQF